MQTNLLVYEVIIAAITEQKVRAIIRLTADCGITNATIRTVMSKGNKAVQSALVKSEVTPAAVAKRNGKFDVQSQWKKMIFLNVNKPPLAHS